MAHSTERERKRADGLRILQRERAQGLQVGHVWIESTGSLPGAGARCTIAVRWQGRIIQVDDYDTWDRLRRNGQL